MLLSIDRVGKICYNYSLFREESLVYAQGRED